MRVDELDHSFRANDRYASPNLGSLRQRTLHEFNPNSEICLIAGNCTF